MATIEATNNDLIYFDEVEEAYSENPTKALKDLVDKMLLLDQSKVELSVFMAANEIKECQKCGRQLGEFRYGQVTDNIKCYGTICQNCEDNIDADVRRWRRDVKVEAQWRELLLGLSLYSKHYHISEPKEGNYHGRHIVLTDPTDKTISARIQRESFGGRAWPYKTKQALRVYSSEYGIEYDKLRSDFDANGIVKRLHTKCLDVIRRVKEKKQWKVDAKDAVTEFKKKAKELFKGRTLRFKTNCNHTVYVDNVKVVCYHIEDDSKHDRYFNVADIKTRDTEYDWECMHTASFPTHEVVLVLVDAINNGRNKK